MTKVNMKGEKIWKTTDRKTRIRTTITTITTIITIITITGTIATKKIGNQRYKLWQTKNTRHAKCVLCIMDANIILVTCIKNLYT